LLEYPHVTERIPEKVAARARPRAHAGRHAGLTEAVLQEFDAAITHHELIKVRVRAGDRETRDAIIARLCEQGAAELVARIGNVALLYRRNADEPRIPLPV